MAKKYIYELKEINEIFHDKCAAKNPDKNPIETSRMLTPRERTNMFQEILNEKGAEGWRLISANPLSQGEGGPFYFIFEKEVYGKKTNDSS